MLKAFLLILAQIYAFICGLCDALHRDFISALFFIRFLFKLRLISKKRIVLADRLTHFAKITPNKPCILFNDETWTFKQIEDYSNRVANLFMHRFKLQKGDCVALFMENKPEYAANWVGLSKLGVVSALINTNLRSQSLVHSINISKPKYVVYSNELEEAILQVKDQLTPGIELIAEDKTEYVGNVNMKALLSKVSDEPIQLAEPIDIEDTVLYIFTSGTTGLPKPAVIKQSRLVGAGFTFYEAARLTPADIVYVSLPLYHSNGTMVGLGQAFTSGCTVVVRKKFSASQFWADCIKYECTAFVYVGEICRFLVNQPESPLDRAHKVRVAIGNGMRANVWKEFYRRYGVRCVEFYASTEGNCALFNLTGKIGACGFMPLLNSYVKILKYALVKIDTNNKPIRDSNGHCILTNTNEPGLLIGLIGTSFREAYNGYANNAKETNNKIIENVFKEGQKAFNSGDMMVMDRFGYLYFCDRLGDTFRWKGENVATIEVENAISARLNSAEVVVYGVEIPGQEGRAGMAAIIVNPENKIDLDTLANHLNTDLPTYARPIFIRLVTSLEHTGTFKAQKNNLVKEGYNVNVINDKVYMYNNVERTFKEFTCKQYEGLTNGTVRI